MEGTVTQFEIEWAGLLGGRRPVVIARKLVPGEVRLAPGATLAGCPVAPSVEYVHVRRLAPDGRPRADLVGFELADPRDLSCFAVGQVVDLAGSVATPSSETP